MTYPLEKSNDHSLALFAILNTMMVVVSVPVLFLFVERPLSQLLENNYFFILVIIFVAQLGLSIFLLVSYKAEVFDMLKYEARQIFPGMVLVAILSCAFSSVISSTMF